MIANENGKEIRNALDKDCTITGDKNVSALF
jgi:hypothetical protein